MKLSYKEIEKALARKKMNFSDLKSVTSEVIEAIESEREIEPKAAGMLAEELEIDIDRITYTLNDTFPPL